MSLLFFIPYSYDRNPSIEGSWDEITNTKNKSKHKEYHKTRDLCGIPQTGEKSLSYGNNFITITEELTMSKILTNLQASLSHSLYQSLVHPYRTKENPFLNFSHNLEKNYSHTFKEKTQEKTLFLSSHSLLHSPRHPNLHINIQRNL